jgi:hypothetical protein
MDPRFPFESNASFSVALNSIPFALFATIDGGGCHNVPRRGQDESGCQSVQEPDWIKQNSYASPFVFQNITIEQTDRVGINRRKAILSGQCGV